MCKKLLFCLLILLCLTGCGGKEPVKDSGGTWEVPSLSYGVMECEKLEVLEWDNRRTEATSFCRFAESETGYYMTHDNVLMYADKANLDLWVPVCSSPDCSHLDYSCDARLIYYEILYRSGRLYYMVPQDLAQGYYNGESDTILASMAPNGTNRKYVYALPEEYAKNKVASGNYLTPQCWYRTVVILNPDGTHTVNAYITRENGWECVISRDATDTSANAWTSDADLQSTMGIALRGDTLVYCAALELDYNVYYRFEESGAHRIDTTELPVDRGYLSGNTLRYFLTNDGYYDMNIDTHEVVKLAEPRMENSEATVVLPNCIIETTLTGPKHFDLRREDTPHRMELFDGTCWRSVELPEELEHAGSQVLTVIKAVTSDSIIFVSRDMSDFRNTFQTSFYRIDLTKESLEAEFMYCYIPAWLKTGDTEIQ